MLWCAFLLMTFSLLLMKTHLFVPLFVFLKYQLFSLVLDGLHDQALELLAKLWVVAQQ